MLPSFFIFVSTGACSPKNVEGNDFSTHLSTIGGFFRRDDNQRMNSGRKLKKWRWSGQGGSGPVGAGDGNNANSRTSNIRVLRPHSNRLCLIRCQNNKTLLHHHCRQISYVTTQLHEVNKKGTNFKYLKMFPFPNVTYTTICQTKIIEINSIPNQRFC